MRALNNYPRRRYAKGRAEIRRQRIERRIRVAMREFYESLPARIYVPKNFTPYGVA